MKNNRFPIVLIFSFAIVSFITSCTKSGNGSVKTQLLGTWKQTQAANDANNNGIRDANEVYNVTADASFTIIFKSGGVSLLLEPVWGGGYDTLQFAYKVINKTLTVYIDTDSTSVLIDSISSKRLILKDTSSMQPASWEIFEKQ